MEYLIAKKLREEWGDKPCNHSKIEREYFGDTHTLDYVCRQCGKEFALLEMLENRDNQKRLEKVNV
jgi:hypothetical protein